MERIACSFDESKRVRKAGYPQGTSFFRWYWKADREPQLAPRHEKWQWATVLGKPDTLFDGYPLDWPDGPFEWIDAPSAEELLSWKPSASLISLHGDRHATAEGKICRAATLADALANALCEGLGVGGYTRND